VWIRRTENKRDGSEEIRMEKRGERCSPILHWEGKMLRVKGENFEKQKKEEVIGAKKEKRACRRGVPTQKRCA